MLNGIINIYKEAGFTSHDVVAKMRGILGQKKIGHTGTLDPAAVGVLPVCLGKATKVCELLSDKDKVYRCDMLLGTVTDTQDTCGTVLSRLPKLRGSVCRGSDKYVSGPLTGSILSAVQRDSRIQCMGK